MTQPLKVWFLASEVAPFAKTGGLADVAGSLPACLKNLGVDIRVGLPFYRTVKDGSFEIKKSFEGLEVPLGDTILRGDILETSTEEGIPVYLFDREDFFGRPGLYGTPKGDYPDNLERFSYFCRAALLFAKELPRLANRIDPRLSKNPFQGRSFLLGCCLGHDRSQLGVPRAFSCRQAFHLRPSSHRVPSGRHRILGQD
ncbi:MAG: glycogen/starch synthase [Deltaproteobacteria bacterium]|nr:glycogen/starch synthase [Deltaproteobacteria bacterium]